MDTAKVIEDEKILDVSEDEAFEVDQPSSSNLPIFITWASVVVAISAAVFFWLLGHSLEQDLKDKKVLLSEVVSVIVSPAYKDVEKQASSFKSAVNELSSAHKSSFPMNLFMPQVYGRINKNVVITSIAISDDGNLNIVGSTDTYRSAAEQVLSLKEWEIDGKKVLSEVSLGSVSLNILEDGSTIIPISITAKYDSSIDYQLASGTADPDVLDNEEGGQSDEE